MKHLILFLFLALFNHHHSLAQTDSLQPREKDVIYITKLLDSLPYFIRTGEAQLFEKSECDWPDHNSYHIGHNKFAFSKQGLELRSGKRQAYIVMYACYYESSGFYAKQDYKNAKKWTLKALEIAIGNDFVFEELHLYRESLNNIFFLEGDFSAAMKISIEGLAKAEKINDKFLIAHYNNVLGCIMVKLQNFELARKYFLEELKFSREINNRMVQAHAFMNLADVAIAENKNKEAMANIYKALPLYKYSPFSFLDKEVYAYNKLSEVYKRIGENDSAIKYGLWAVNNTEKNDVGNLYDRANYYVNAGDIYNRLLQPDNALSYLRKGLKFADSIKHREDLRDVYEQFALSFALKKQFDSAYIYQQAFSKLKDSIVNENSERDILKRDAALQLERQGNIQQAELSRQQTWRNIIIGISIFIFVITVMLYNRRRIKQKILYQQQLNKQQNELMNTVIVVQDKERKRIAEDLHDSLGSILSAAKLKLSAVAETSSVNGNGHDRNYEDTMNLLDDAVNEMRNISHNLLPASLLRLGVVPGLRNLIDKISSKSGLQINFIAYGFKGRIDETIEVSIYRIILEAINNVVKHAKAKNVIVQLMQYDSYINILVEDDGIGFDRSVVKDQGIGLNNILSRVDYMKGKIDIDTKPKGGTVINIDIPYRQNIS